MKKINMLFLSTFVVMAAFSFGCANAQKGKLVDESSLDSDLAAMSVPLREAPKTDPGNPQPQFDQEPLQAQGL